MSNPYISPFAKPVYVMLKPVGSVCNLACEYCYYLEKGKLYPEVKNHIMSEQLLEKSSRNIWNVRRCRRFSLPGTVVKR